MNVTLPRPSDRVSQFVRDALLSPDQVNDVVLTSKEADAKGREPRPERPAHAHGDFGHADR